jgi:6-pyruvoyltetrahydropterin/6-carboxytetrahydropterin synthase
MKKTAIYRKEHFNAAHRLHSAELSDEENSAIFGKCNSPNFHGHNYELVVKVTGETESPTGYVMDMGKLSGLIRQQVIARFDHMNLNLDVPEFKKLNPTAENIAMVIYNILRPLINEKLDLKIILHETERNSAEYPA